MRGRHSAGSASAISRREFVKLSGAGIVGVSVLGVMGSSGALARNDSTLTSEAKAASDEHGVPADLLLALGYVSARWETPPESAGAFEPGDIHGAGGFGIMGLSEDPQNDTLSRAADLTGIPEEKLKIDRAANVTGAAAVLSDIQGESPSDINGWFEAVAEYSGTDLYANQVYETLEEGASEELESGEKVTLAPQEEAETQRLYTAQATGDYSGSTYYGAYSGNYSAANRPSSNPIRRVIIHVMEGSWSGTINYFKDSRAGVSAHYNVRSSDGAIGQSVREKDIAYHAGDWPYNQTSVGIEHEGYTSQPGRWFTDAMYRSSARLTAYLCRKYDIPVSRNNIIGHYQVPGCSSGTGGGYGCHTDPGSGWNWTKYMDLIRSYAGGGSGGSENGQVVDNSSPRFSASSDWISSDYSSDGYGSDYRVLQKPSKEARPARYKVSIPKSGDYAVYAWWPANSGYNNRARYEVRTTSGWKTKTVSQRANGGKWNLLGAYAMSAGDRTCVQVNSESSGTGYIIADAVKVVAK